MNFTCPRCVAKTEADSYGPCAACRADLIETQVSIPNEYTLQVAGDRQYTPKMNVVPNQIATKE